MDDCNALIVDDEADIRELIEMQEGQCALTGLKLNFDDPDEDAEMRALAGAELLLQRDKRAQAEQALRLALLPRDSAISFAPRRAVPRSTRPIRASDRRWTTGGRRGFHRPDGPHCR